MGRVAMQASEGLELPGMGGLVLVGAVLKRFTTFQATFNSAFTKGPGGIPFGDVLVPGLAMLCTGKSDFEAVSQLRGSAWAARALQVKHIASPEALRQNLDLLGEKPPAKLRIKGRFRGENPCTLGQRFKVQSHYFSTLVDGARSVRFIEKTVDSSRCQDKWTMVADWRSPRATRPGGVQEAGCADAALFTA